MLSVGFESVETSLWIPEAEKVQDQREEEHKEIAVIIWTSEESLSPENAVFSCEIIDGRMGAEMEIVEFAIA